MLHCEHIKKYARQAGFALCGVARARVLVEQGERLAAGLAASGEAALGYLTRDPGRRLDPSRLLAGVRTVAVCAVAYDGRPLKTPEGLVSAHRRDGDYHPRIKAMLGEVARRLRDEQPDLRIKICCDTAPILEKAWAVEAGLGWIGRNSLLINPEFGSFLLLGELLLDAECDRYDEPRDVPGCGLCRRCESACPAGALRAGTVDTGRCISALTIERGRSGAAVQALHGWICGCDECQTVCPYQKNGLKRKIEAEIF